MNRKLPLALLALAVAACQDPTSTPRSVTPAFRTELEDDGPPVHKYVAIGTSISMGWQSDGVVEGGQRQSWPAQLARAAGSEMTQPYLSAPGCRSPLAAPLASGVRLSGEGAGAPAASFSCAPLVAGVELPVRNVAIAAASTRDALYTTPELQADVFYSKLYPRVLPSGQTQLSAALGQKPRLVSVELGGNEVLNARSGIAIPGVTITPVSQWTPLYTRLANIVAEQGRRGVLVGLIDDVGTFPSFRRGDEIWADRLTFLGAFHVAIDANCAGSQNLIFVPVRVPTAVATGLAYRANNLPPFAFSCADGGLGVQDFVLTPAEAGVVNATMAAMNAHILQTANRIGFAHFELQVLYGRSDLKPPFSVVQLMTSATPYGPYVSLDGIHPSGAGHTVLAAAAANALNATYGYSLPAASAFTAN